MAGEAATNYGSAVTMYTSDGVNVRSQPSTSSDVSATLGLGTAVTVVGETPNWYVVSTGSGTGYISKGLLNQTAPEGAADASADQSGAQTQASSGGSGYISGVITSASGDSITITGDDGNTYNIYTGAAEISASEGLNSGLYVSVGYSVNGDGSISATQVTG